MQIFHDTDKASTELKLGIYACKQNQYWQFENGLLKNVGINKYLQANV